MQTGEVDVEEVDLAGLGRIKVYAEKKRDGSKKQKMAGSCFYESSGL